MTELPWWYGTIANVLAIGFSVWVGIHYRSPEWLALYIPVALVTAALPAHRKVGLVGIAVGIAVAAVGFYLMRGVDFELGKVVSATGGPASPAREVAAIALAAAWLVIGSAYRTRRA